MQVGERAALRHLIARRVDVEGVDLVEIDVPGCLGRDDNGVIAPAVGGVVLPGAAPDRAIARGQAISAGARGPGVGGVEGETVLPAARRHQVGFVIVAVVRSDEVAARRMDAFLRRDAVAVDIRQGGIIASVQVGENLHRRRIDVGRVGIEHDGERNGVSRDLIHVDMTHGVVRIHAIDRQRRVHIHRVGAGGGHGGIESRVAGGICPVEIGRGAIGVVNLEVILDRPGRRRGEACDPELVVPALGEESERNGNVGAGGRLVENAAATLVARVASALELVAAVDRDRAAGVEVIQRRPHGAAAVRDRIGRNVPGIADLGLGRARENPEQNDEEIVEACVS